MNKKEREQHFINKSNIIHFFKYDYSSVIFINQQTKVVIICPIHNEFQQVPMSHIKGVGCPMCAVNQRQTTMKLRTGYNHALQNPISHTKQKSTMLEKYGVKYASQHQPFQEKKKQTLKSNYGVDYTFHSPEIQQKIRKTMLDNYGVEYTLQSDTLRQKCFDTMIERYGTDNLSKKYTASVSQWLYDNDWLYDEYINQNKSAQLIADELQISGTTVLRHLHTHEINIRYFFKYSCKSIRWLSYIMHIEHVDIQHALNGGEYKISGTRYKADGYCKYTNTVYEFHGDKFHGNPKVFMDTELCHPFDKHITAKELYQMTIDREEVIKSLGYNLVVMWESDWTLIEKEIQND